MGELVRVILGGAGGSVLFVFLAVSFMLTFFLPLMAFCALRHLKGIRVELKRLNDARDGLSAAPRAGVLGI